MANLVFLSIILISVQSVSLALFSGFFVGLEGVVLLLLYENYKTSGSRDSFWGFVKKWLKR